MFAKDTERQNVVFVDQLPEELRCPFHRGVFEDPQVAQCGHTFCRRCVPIDENLGETVSCPVCLANLTGIFFPNLALEAIISHLRVYCKNRKEDTGCQTVIPLGELPIHEQGCEFSPKEDCSQSKNTGKPNIIIYQQK